MKILIVAAHPDDEILGAGGTIAKHVKSGDEVDILLLSKGVMARYNQKNKHSSKMIDEVNTQAKRIGAMLNTGVVFRDFPDNKFDSVPLLDIIKSIEEIIAKYKPEIIYTHWEHDLNIDHKITFQAVMTATRPIGSSVKKILSFEVPSSSEWNFTKSFRPNYYINIEDTINYKIKAMKMYEGEIRKYPHPRSEEGIRILAKRRGMETDLKYAEAFRIIREIA